MEKPNAVVILNCRSRLVSNYLSKGFFIIEKYSKHLRIIPNDVKSIIHVIDEIETYFVMKKKHSNFLCRKHDKQIAHTV